MSAISLLEMFSIILQILSDDLEIRIIFLVTKMANACKKNKLSTNWRPLNLAIVAEGANLILFRR